MRKWQAVVFDLDDTLYPEDTYVLSGFRAAAAWAEYHLGIPLQDGFAELENLFNQGARGDTFNRWLALHTLHDDSLLQQLVQVYREHQPLLKPFLGVPELLESLHQRFLLGMLSDGYIEVQQRKLAALGLTHYFDAIVFSDTWGPEAWKPSTKPFQVMLERLDVEAAQTVYVADNPMKDFLGARRVGIATIWLRWFGGEYTHLQPPTSEYASDLMVDSLDALNQVILSNGDIG